MGVGHSVWRLALAVALLLTILASPPTWEVGSAHASAEGAKTIGEAALTLGETDAPVTVWHIPHPDDETLGMAGGIMAAAARGERNVVVLYTQGGNSDVRLVLNGLFYCLLHGRFHNPVAEGYDVLDVHAFKAARVAETVAALGHLGVDEQDVILLDLPDGALQVGPVFEVMVELDRHFPGARHRTTSVTDRHQDHKTLARALYRLKEFKEARGVELDVAFYRVYHFGGSQAMRAAASGVQVASVEDPERKRRALAEFGHWEPEAGRFAVGMHSVPRLLRAAADDTDEYLDAPDSLPLFGLRSAGSLSLSVFAGETALNYRIGPRWGLRVGAPYTIDALRSAVVYEKRSLSAAVMLYAGWGTELTDGRFVPYSLAGMRIVDRFIVEYRLPSAPLGRGSALQIGLRLDI